LGQLSQQANVLIKRSNEIDGSPASIFAIRDVFIEIGPDLKGHGLRTRKGILLI
jgi:hypothetical protein